MASFNWVRARAECSLQRTFEILSSVVETDVRDNSIRMRSAELERIKRDADTPNFKGSDKPLKFSEIKEDFEKLQENQSSIIKAYTTGRTIDYSKISESAAEMKRHAVRLDTNLFLVRSDKIDKNLESKYTKQKDFRDLIVVIDSALGAFVNNSIFRNTKVVNPIDLDKAQIELQKIIKMSENLSEAARKMK